MGQAIRAANEGEAGTWILANQQVQGRNHERRMIDERAAVRVHPEI